jgi:FHA domain
VTETGLIIAQVVFVLLLYGFIWAIVRSSTKELGSTEPRPSAAQLEDPVRPRPAAVTPAPPPEPDPVAAPTPPPPMPEPELAAVVVPQPSTAPDDELQVEESGAFDLSDELSPRFVVERSSNLEPGTEIALEGGLTIGRSASSGVRVEDEFVSHMHARVRLRGQFYFISDLGSTNGTFVNERRVTTDQQLRVRDEIRVGATVLRYEE